jgi:heat shock protein beta
MHLLINSVYKTKEIFLRELISNASDALDKIRFLSLTDSEALSTHPDLKIQVSYDMAQHTITIRDTGVGMTRTDLRDNLGTLARSGTAEFVKAVESGKADLSLIGQFGVGFYSAFLVADRVHVVSKSNNDPDQWVWESAADGDFIIKKDESDEKLGRGTKITLYLKEDAIHEYLSEYQLKELVARYSEFINFPIELETQRTETEEVPDETAEEKPADEEKKEESDVEDVDKDKAEEKKEKKRKMKKISREVREWQVLNTNKPIWTRDAKTVNETEYQSFYKALTKDSENPLAWSHFKAEGDVSFKALIFIPSHAQSELYQVVRDMSKNVKLFVKRVFITDELGDDFLPKWLGFLWAVVDAEDVPLNISRETLQHSKVIRAVRKKLISKAFDLLFQLSKEDKKKYDTIREQFGASIKLGAIEDVTHRPKLLKLIRFHSSNGDDRTGLEEYVSRMKHGQPSIYFMTGQGVAEIKQSPFVEKLLARGYEVLFLDEPIDEYIVQNISEFDGKKLVSVAKSGLKFGDEDDEEEKELQEDAKKYMPLTDWLRTVLDDHVEQVTVSNRLTTSPCALAANSMGWSGNMEKIMSSQAMNKAKDTMRQFYINQRKILEINPKHPLIESLLDHVQQNEEADRDVELAKVLFETTQIRSGYEVKDKKEFAKRVERVMRRTLKVDLDKEADVVIKPAPESSNEREQQVEEVVGEEETTEKKVEHDEL